MDVYNLWEVQTLTPAASGSGRSSWKILCRGTQAEMCAMFRSKVGTLGAYRLLNAQLKEVARTVVEIKGVGAALDLVGKNP